MGNGQGGEDPSSGERSPKISVCTLPPAIDMTLAKLIRPTDKNGRHLLEALGVQDPVL